MFNWKIAGAAVQGLAHAENNTPCQDKIFSMKASQNLQAIALADGAGCYAMSHYGAEEAVKAACEIICSEFNNILSMTPQDAGKLILDFIRIRLEKKAEELGCGFEELGSTLIAAGANQDSILIVHLGDGMAAYFKDGALRVASYPDNGEFKNETVFTSSNYDEALSRIRLYKGSIAGVSGVALMSDGADSSFFNSENQKFAKLLTEIKQKCLMYQPDDVNENLNDLFTGVIRKQTRDDCSLIIMCRPDEYFRGYRDLDDYDQYYFLGVKSAEAKENREKILSAFADSGHDYIPQPVILKHALALGLKRRQISGIMRDLIKNGFIERSGLLSKRYKLNFLY